jgi:D-glycero-alpha-D-manno-heptose 1-phosphate guanylyltransferase
MATFADGTARTSAQPPAEALILAGGLGTRLRPAVPDLPKPMAPVNGRPFLAILMEYWRRQGIERFVLSVGWMAERIISHFGSAFQGASVEYLREETPLGTGGALALALNAVDWRCGNVLLLNGDTWLTASLPRLTADARPELPATLTLLHVARNDRYGGVEPGDQGRVRRFGLPADGGAAFINAGCVLVNAGLARHSLRGFPERFSLENDWLAPLAAQGLVGASVQDAEFVDIGVPEDYRRFCLMVERTC